LNKSRATKRKRAFVKKATKRAKAMQRPAKAKAKAKPKPKRQEAKMAETRSSQSLGEAADAEEKALRKGKGGAGGNATVNVYDDIKGPESFTYNPRSDDPQETVVFGKLVKKGEAVEFDDPRQIQKLRNNQSFWDDAKRKKMDENNAARVDNEAKARAVATEQELIEAMAIGENGEEIDTRLPEAPQLASISQAKQRKLVEELNRIQNAEPPPPEGGATRRGRKASDE